MLRLLLLSLLWITSSHASATDYYFFQYGGNSTPSYPSFSSACNSLGDARATAVGYTFVSGTMSDFSDMGSYAIMSCNITADKNDGTSDQWYYSITIERDGNSCPSGSTYNQITGACVGAQADGDLCTDQTGAKAATSSSIALPMIYDSAAGGCVQFPDAAPAALCKYLASTDNGTSSATYSVDGIINDIGLGVAPPTFVTNAGGCEYKTLLTSSCKVKSDGTSSCVVTAQLTGKVGTVSTGDSTKSTLCTSPAGCKVDTTPVTTYTDTGCTSTGNCTQETKSDTTGSQNCLTSGSLVCNNSAPKSTDVKTVSSTASTTATDGTVTSTTTADKTTTSCTDVNKCTTTSTTVKSTSATTSSGGTSTSSTCTGSCTGTGTAEADTDDDDDDSGSASTSNDCTTPPACSGDKYSCAILSQSWINSCATRALPTTDEAAAFEARVTAQQASLDASQTALDDSVTSYLSNFESTAISTSGGSCFTDTNVSFHGSSFVLPWSKVCPYLIYLRYGLILVAYLGAARMLSREV